MHQQLMKDMFNIQGYSIIKSERVSKEAVNLYLKRELPMYCPHCGLESKTIYDSRERRILIGSNMGLVINGIIKRPRIHCKSCEKIVAVETHFSAPMKRYSYFVEERIPVISYYVNNKTASELTGISTSQFYRIDRDCLTELEEKLMAHIPDIDYLGADEISRRKGHTYTTVLYNQSESRVVWLEEGRTSSSMKRALEKVKPKLTNTIAASIDLWDPYIVGIEERLPSCDIVFDRFHLTRVLNSYLEEERRKYQTSLSQEERVFMKKGMRWILLKRLASQNLMGKRQLNELKNQNNRLYELYLLKEDLLGMYETCQSPKQAFKYIVSWAKFIHEKGFKCLEKFVKTLASHIHGVLNWFTHRISNGRIEGINNKIKTIKRNAYGYKDPYYFRLKVLQKCGYLMNAHPLFLK